MRRTVQTRSLRRRAAIAAVPAAAGLVLAACGGGGEEAASSSTPPAPVDEAKGLTQQDLPAGLTVSTVESENALMTALQSVQQVQDSAIEPAACKDKNVAAQQEVAETVKSGVQQTVAKGQTVLYGVTLLPGDVKPAVFEAAGTGECATVTFGGSLQQTTVRADLPSGTDGATGFVFEISRKTGDRTAVATSAYFAKGGVTAMVNANPGADGKVDRAVFEDLIRRVAAKL